MLVTVAYMTLHTIWNTVLTYNALWIAMCMTIPLYYKDYILQQ